MPMTAAETVFPTQRPNWADEAMAHDALTDHGHVVDGRTRESTLGYLARMRAWRMENPIDIKGDSVIGCILFKVMEKTPDGKLKPADAMKSLSVSYQAGKDLGENMGKLLKFTGRLFLKDVPDPIDRIKSFDWSEGAKSLEAERGKVERMGPSQAHPADEYAAYPRRGAAGMNGRASDGTAALAGAARALPAPPRALPAPPGQLPRPDRGQDR